MSSRPRTPAFPTASSVFGRSSRFDTHSDVEVPRYGSLSEAANERHQMMDLDVGAPVIAALLQNMYRQMNNSANPLQPKASQSPAKKHIDVSQMTDEGDMTMISAMLRNRFSDSSQNSSKDRPASKIDMGNVNFRPRPDGQNIQKLLAHSWSQGPCIRHPLGRPCSKIKPSSDPKLKHGPKFVEQNKQMVKSLSHAMLSVKGLGRSGVLEVTESVLGHKDKPKTALEQLQMPSKTNKIYYPPNNRRQNSEVAFGSGAERDANVPSTKERPPTPGGYDTSGNYAQETQPKRHNYGLKLGNFEDVEGAYEARKAMKDTYLVVSDQQAIQLLRAKLEQRLASKANGGLRAAFKVFDRDGSGTVAAEELGTVFSNLNLELPPKQIQSLMKVFDADGSGIIDYNEFISNVLGDGTSGADVLRGKAAPLTTVKKDAIDRPQTPSDRRPLSATPSGDRAGTETAELRQSKSIRPASSTGFSMLNSIGPYDPQNYRTILINNSIQQRIWQYRDCFRSIVQGSSVVPRSFVKDIMCKVDGTDSWSDQMVDIICAGAEVEEAKSHRMERPSTGMRSTRFGTNDRSAVVGVILRNLRACAQEAMLESVAAGTSRPIISTFSPAVRAVVSRGIKL